MIQRLFTLVLALFAATTTAHAEPQGLVVLHCGQLLAEPGQEPMGESTVVIENGVITNIFNGIVFVDAAPGMPQNTHIDLTDKFVLPGLIDCHTHLTFELPPMQMRLRKQLTEDATYEAVDGTHNALKTLMAGFTTVRNVGSGGAAIYALRNRIAEGVIPGPRILAAGKSISVTGGHADPTNGINPALSPALTSTDGIANGPDEFRHATRERIRQGSDLIKITSTGGVLSNTAAGLGQQMFDDEIEAVVETAHMMGRKVACHAHGTDGINAALRAGVDSIEHGTFLDESSIALFKETGAYLVPTIHAGKFVSEKASDPAWFNPAIKEKAEAVGPIIQDALARAHKAGVKVAFGTDVGVGAHGTNALEFVYMVEAGFTPADAIKAATVNAADLCGIGDTVGKIAKGYQADIIAVDTNPLDDVAILQNVSFVMKGGKTFKHAPNKDAE
ncbi:MAG: amidohydrolase family protein [Phycisphaerales bacterium]|nr:amidohydrolase family protein [Phycisphaerales bacterium]MCB9835834.1 amidohydrolase family protein [Phycisphaera sp.]